MLLHIPNLRRLYSGNDCVRAIVDHLAASGERHDPTVVAAMWKALREKAFTFPRSEVFAAFKSLQHVGAGTLIVGRKGRPTRFHHTVGIAELVKAARGEGEGASGKEAEAAAADPVTMFRHQYILRPDLHLTVHLPADLTKTEATRLAEFIRSLPFE